MVSKHGRYRFQSGMITANLLERGLGMDDSFALSRALRRDVAELDEVTTDELEARLQRLVIERLGEPLAPVTPQLPLWAPVVRTASGDLPFSRGVLLRSLLTAGLEMGPAMEVGEATLSWLQQLDGADITEEQIEDRVGRRLREQHGAAFARRFQLTGWLRRSRRPVILLLGGATGTGKSTLATELAFRLGIRMVTSTDLIRETMRAVLSPAVVPGLYDHSFRGTIQGGQVLSNPRERVLLGFRQQAAQVAVGIRAVIRRSIRENSHLIIEGTHLIPPFRQYLPPGADVTLAGLLLAVPSESRHQARFPMRARQARERDESAYLDSFQSVRWIHDDLLHAAEENGEFVVDNRRVDKTVAGVVGYLSEHLPSDERVNPDLEAPSHEQPPTLFIILDGLADEPIPALGGRTPLQAADTPNLRLLAGSGGLGLIHTGSTDGVAPETSEGMMALLGEPMELGRGLLEALGHGVPLPSNAVFFRGNLATRQPDGLLADRRAGRIRSGVPDLVATLRNVPLRGGIVGHVYPGHEHRVIVALQGTGLSDDVSDTDPGSNAVVQRRLVAAPTSENSAARRTAAALEELLLHAERQLADHPHNLARTAVGQFPANTIITRGASSTSQLPVSSGDDPPGALISGCGTALGVARALGYRPATSPAMTGNLDTDLNHKFQTARTLLDEHTLVVMHIKGTDIAAHDRQPLLKRDFLEQVDKALGTFLKGDIPRPLRLVVSADHGTSSNTGNHLADPVPLLLASWDGGAEPADFDEDAAQDGALGMLRAGDLAGILQGRSIGMEVVGP